MSYQVLARKYRPKSFDTLVGQEHVVRALSHALQTRRLHHAYLFTGTRGVGKTTLSRILAKSFNCVGPDGQGDITASPCGVCDVCQAVDAGRFVDYIEMDAASNRGVDEMAQLLEQAVYAPTNARFKVYMIDEVHMLTNTAFNAMLKTLEEPPPHIKFILATTDPQKIPVTVLSRCLQFNLKQMPPGHIIGHLENILTQENISFETPALRLLAQGAHGSMRDALSLTDQAIAYAAGQVSLEAVQGMLGALDQSFLVRLLDALAREDGADLIAVADEMATRSLSYNNALQDLASILHQMALAQTVPQALAADLPEREEILRLAQVFDAEEVQLFYQIAVHGRNELGLAPDEYAGFTMSLLRMLAFRPSSGMQFTGTAPAGPARAQRPAQAAPAAVSTRVNLTQNAVPAMPPPAMSAMAAPAPQTRPTPAAPPNPGLSPAKAALQALRGTPNAPSARAAGAAQVAAPVLSPVTEEGTDSAAAIQAIPAMPPIQAPAAPSLTLVANNERSPNPNQNPSRDAGASAPPWEEDGQWNSDDAAFFGGQAEREEALPPRREAPSAPRQTAAPMKKVDPSIAAALRIAERAGVRPPGEREEQALLPVKPVAVVEQEAPPFVKLPLPEINFDGDWPQLVAQLPLKGISQAFAFASELASCSHNGNSAEMVLRLPLQTLASPANQEKLEAVLQEHFGQIVKLQIKVESPVWHTANARAEAARAARLREAQAVVEQDSYVRSLIAEFGARVNPASVRPFDGAQ